MDESASLTRLETDLGAGPPVLLPPLGMPKRPEVAEDRVLAPEETAWLRLLFTLFVDS